MTQQASYTVPVAKPCIHYRGGCWPTNIRNVFIDIGAMVLPVAVTLAVLISGLIAFSHVEKTFLDVV